MKRFGLLLAIALCLSLGWAQAITLPVEGGGVEILPAELEDGRWFFLPAFAQIEALFPDAEETDEEGVWHSPSADASIMVSSRLRALFLFSDDPVKAGRAYIENCEKHENQTTGSMAIIAPDGTVDHADDLRQLRGRGNWTWAQPKKGYQIKLENRADLLKTGSEDNRARTWVLLAESMDGTLLHNRISMDLARELGLNAVESEFVDLYYDGEYCGTYLLCEKVEIGPGRVDELDYDDLLETWNNKVGQFDLESLPAVTDENRYGKRFTYIDSVVATEDPSAGAYLLEMENEQRTLSDRAYFDLGDGAVYASKNPENPTKEMMRYISERFTQARRTIENGGTDPETGLTAEEAFDLDGFARSTLLHELSWNADGFTYSSAFFVLPAGETRFEAGPVWDFDLAYRYRWDGGNEAAAGFKDSQGWLTDFYGTDSFLRLAKEIYLQEISPLVEQVLLGDQQGEYLKPLSVYADHIAASRRMNERVWDVVKEGRFRYGNTYEEEIDLLARFLKERNAWLSQAMSDLQPGESHIPLWMDVRYGDAEESVRIHTAPWQGVTVESIVCEQLTEADEESYAQWQLEAVLTVPQERMDASISLNGTELNGEWQEDGTLLLSAVYEDRSYRFVDYYGDDIGLVYDYEYYIRRYPEVLEEAGDDPEAVMDYFCDEGMYLGHVGNPAFDPAEALRLNPYLEGMFGEEWQLYYWDFIYYGYDEGWMKQNTERFVPEVYSAD